MFDNNVILFEGINYHPSSFDFINSDLIKETNILYSHTMLLEFANNSYEERLILEAITDIKNSLISAMQKLYEIIKNLNAKFQNFITRLVSGNKKWIEKIKAELDENTINDKFSYEIFPYWKNSSKLLSYKFPDFQENNVDFLEELKDEDKFKEKYFKDLFITVDGKTTFDPKTFFRGSDKKVSINKKELLAHLKYIITFVENYSELTRPIVDRNNKLLEILNKGLSKIKTAPLKESNMILETVLTLLEQGDKPITTKDIDKNSIGDTKNPEQDKRIGEKDPNIDVKTEATIRQTYNKICYQINSARMMIAEENYNSYVTLLNNAYTSRIKK